MKINQKVADKIAAFMGVHASTLTNQSIVSYLDDAEADVVDNFRKTFPKLASAYDASEEIEIEGVTSTPNETTGEQPIQSVQSGSASMDVKFSKEHVAPKIVTAMAMITAVRVSDRKDSKQNAIVVVEIQLANGEIQTLSFSANYMELLSKNSALRFVDKVLSPNQLCHVQLEERVAGKTTYLTPEKSLVAKAPVTIARKASGVPTAHAIVQHTSDSKVFAGLLGTIPTQEAWDKATKASEKEAAALSAGLLDTKVKAASTLLLAQNAEELNVLAIAALGTKTELAKGRMTAAKSLAAADCEDETRWREYLDLV